MSRGKFEKVEKSKKRMYGKRGLLVCGSPPSEQSALLSLFEQISLGDLPVVFSRTGDLDRTVKDVMNSADRSGMGEDSPMKRAIIMSGLTQKELHTVMTAHRAFGMPSRLWAALTPVSENWNLHALLNELEAESKVMEKKRKNR